MADKFIPYHYIKEPVNIAQAPSSSKSKKFTRIIPSVLITIGSLMIANVAWPILSYQLFTSPQIQKSEFISPIPASQLGSAPVQISSHTPTANPPQVLGADINYTDPKNWFPQAKFSPPVKVESYTIDIPKLDIESAKILIGGDNLDENLIQYPGTANPGQLGSPVIFGHSVLRQFYNPDINNPNRYNSIFSKIMTLKTGDHIFANYDGIRYTYEVKDKVEVHPDDLFILEQRYNNRELKLITCIPEGTYLRRGVIIAQLVNLNPSDTQTN